MEILATPLGFFVGLTLGSLGAGGSILAVPLLVYTVNLEAKVATAASLIVVGSIAMVGTVIQVRAGRVRILPGTLFGLTGVSGSVGGSLLNRTVNPDVLLLAFSGVMVIAAWAMSRHRYSDSPTKVSKPGDPDTGRTLKVDIQTVVKVMVAGSVLGFTTGFFGIGGGFVIVPMLALILGFTMHQAVATSLLVITIHATAALVSRIGAVDIPWDVVLPFTAAGLAGVLVGKRIADKIRSEVLSRAFAVVILILAAYTAGRSIVNL